MIYNTPVFLSQSFVVRPVLLLLGVGAAFPQYPQCEKLQFRYFFWKNHLVFQIF